MSLYRRLIPRRDKPPLTPEEREIIARVARSEAKDSIQDFLELHGVAYRADGTMYLLTDQERAEHDQQRIGDGAFGVVPPCGS
jgi:hypothetical protein